MAGLALSADVDIGRRVRADNLLCQRLYCWLVRTGWLFRSGLDSLVTFCLRACLACHCLLARLPPCTWARASLAETIDFSVCDGCCFVALPRLRRRSPVRGPLTLAGLHCSQIPGACLPRLEWASCQTCSVTSRISALVGPQSPNLPQLEAKTCSDVDAGTATGPVIFGR